MIQIKSIFLIILFILITANLFVLPTSVTADNNSEIVKSIVNYYSDFIKPYLIKGAVLTEMIEKANEVLDSNSTHALMLIEEALKYDTDKDVLPDYIELIDGYNPFDQRSMGEHDLLYYVSHGPIIDGYLVEWNYLPCTKIQLKIQDKNTDLPGTHPVEAMLTRDDHYLYLALKLSDPPIVPSLVSYNVTIIDTSNNKIFTPTTYGYYNNGVEYSYSLPEGNIRVNITIKTDKGTQEYSFTVEKNKIPMIYYGEYSIDSTIHPLKYWYTVIPDNLPWYPLFVFGDNRPKVMSSTKFDPPFYRLLEEMRIINPEAVIGAGDHVGLGTRDQINMLLKLFAGIENPWLVTGNHDWSYIQAGAKRDYWEKMVIPNLMVRDDIPGWRIIFINGYAIEARDVDMKTIKNPVKKEDIINAVTSAGNRSIILVFHVPPLDKGYGYPTVFSYQQMTFLRSIIEKYNDRIKLIICGHWHVWRRTTYLGVDLIITGGGGAPLSGSGGTPVYHYASLILYPNGTYNIWPIKTYGGEIKVYMKHIDNTSYEYIILNSKTNIDGKPVPIPLRIPISISGIELRIYVIAPNGETRISITRSSQEIVIEAHGIKQWFVYGLGETYTPSNNRVVVKLPSHPQLPSLSYSIDEEEKILAIKVPRQYISATAIIHDTSLYSTPLLKTGNMLIGYVYISSDGCYDIEVYYVGSEGVETRIEKVKIDLYPPVITLAKLPPAVSRDFTFIITVKDVSLKWVTVYIDSQLLFNTTTTSNTFEKIINVNTTQLKEGIHTVKVIAGDQTGHIAKATSSFIIDFTPPKITASIPKTIKEGKYCEITISVNDTFFDRGEIYVNGEFKYMFTEPNVKIPIQLLDIILPGTYEITIIAYDKAGNKAEYTDKLTIVPISPTTTTIQTTTTTTTTTSTTTTTTTQPTTSASTTSTTTITTTTTTTSSASATPKQEALPQASTYLVILVLLVVAAIILYKLKKS